MPLPLSLRLVRDGTGGWHLALGHRDTRPADAFLTAGVLEDVRERVRARLRPTSPVLIPGRDGARTRAEEEAGRLLGGLVAADSQVSAALTWQLGNARGQGEDVVLVVDAPDREVRELPWELLATDGPCLEAAGGVVVARLVPGRPARPPATGATVRVLRWSPDPDDEVCQQVNGELDLTLADTGLDPADDLDPDRLPEVPSDRATVLHVVCHGRRLEDHTALLTGCTEQSAATASHCLEPLLPQVALVVLDVCEAGDATSEEIDTLAARLVAAGAPACVAPLTRSSAVATRSFSRGLYASLATGDPIPLAVAAGRRSVRGLAAAHPDSRWANHALYVGSLGVVAQGGLVQRTWSPAGWSRVTPGAARLLDAARREAEAMGAGFVGLEHLVRALGTTADRESLAAIRFALSPYRNALFERLGHLRRVGSRVPDWRGTPRLRALGDVLPADVDVVGLWQAIWNEPTLALQALAEMPVDLVAPGMDSQDRTLEPDGVRLQQLVQTATPTALEVLGGPEDGQRFQPGEGDVVGRHTSGSMTTHGLYRDTVLVDPYLSRSALVWLGPGRVSLSRQAARRRANQWQDVGPGPIHVMVGDQLLITPATRLRVLP